MVPRGTAALSSLSRRWFRSELHADAGVERRFGAGVVTGAHRTVLMIKSELVLTAAICPRDIDEVTVFGSPQQLAGVKRQPDRLAVQLGLGRNVAWDGQIGARSLRSVPASTTADGKILKAFGQEAQIHVVIGLDRPRSVEVGVAVRNPACANERCREEGIVTPFLVKQR